MANFSEDNQQNVQAFFNQDNQAELVIDWSSYPLKRPFVPGLTHAIVHFNDQAAMFAGSFITIQEALMWMDEFAFHHKTYVVALWLIVFDLPFNQYLLFSTENIGG